MDIIKIEEVYYPQIVAIYLEGMATGKATFQTSASNWSEWDKSHLQHSRLAAFEANKCVGWAALSPVSSRCVYAGVAEVSIYIANKHQGKGIGKILFSELISESEKNNLWTLQSSIFPENISSIKLHLSSGFRQIGYKERIGKLNGVWIDNIIMERRSKIVGI